MRKFRALLASVVWSSVFTMLMLVVAVVLTASHNTQWVMVALVSALVFAILSLRSPG